MFSTFRKIKFDLVECEIHSANQGALRKIVEHFVGEASDAIFTLSISRMGESDSYASSFKILQ